MDFTKSFIFKKESKYFFTTDKGYCLYYWILIYHKWLNKRRVKIISPATDTFYKFEFLFTFLHKSYQLIYDWR